MLRARASGSLFFLTIPLRGDPAPVVEFLLPCVAYFLLLYLVGRILPTFRPRIGWFSFRSHARAAGAVRLFAIYALV
jgi:hypothetical protein